MRHKLWIAEFCPSIIVKDHDSIRPKQPKSKYKHLQARPQRGATRQCRSRDSYRLKFAQSLIRWQFDLPDLFVPGAVLTLL